MRKNMLMLTRNRLSTALRFCACLIFMILMKLVIVTIDVANENKEFARNMPHPVEEPIRGISACRSQGCKAFVYTPAPRDQFVPSGEVQDSDFAEGVGDRDAIRRVNRLVRTVLLDNKGGMLEANQVLGFTSERALDDYVSRGDVAGLVDAGVILQSPSAEHTTFILQCNHSKITNVERKLLPIQVSFCCMA